MKCDYRIKCSKYDEIDCNHPDYWVNCPEYRHHIESWARNMDWDKVVALEEQRRIVEAQR